ncbi:MAG: 2-oxoglutarate dehydrogenase E1 component [Gammaproteobacteria bacterium]
MGQPTDIVNSHANLAFLEPLYETYERAPETLSPAWRAFFAGVNEAPPPQGGSAAPFDNRYFELQRQKQVSVLQLINAYRFRGHRQADLDPLRQYERPIVPELDPAFHGLGEEDLGRRYDTGSLYGPPQATLGEILDTVRTTYCRSIGAEYMHINDTNQKRWIQQRLETTRATPDFSPDQKRRVLDRLVAAATLEQYLHRKYVGQKRFSLEGGDSAIALLDELIQGAGELGAREAVIGMTHRGRINVLVNVVGKHPAELFDEFEGKGSNGLGSGDVKYHLGYSSDIDTPGGPVHVALAFNPSHLEIINPVVEGSVRARQEKRDDKTGAEVLPVLIHGDAAFAGQGVVMETFNLSQTRGYATGGTVHIVINNQIGFTTSDPLDSRSTLYCTDVAKMVQAPIFHVNGDDPEAVVMVARLALEFRMELNKDVVIDLVCFRRHGHSEADEPAATQPLMYEKIGQHPGVVQVYAERLRREGLIDDAEVERLARHYTESLERNEVVAGPLIDDAYNDLRISFAAFHGKHWREGCDTTLPAERIEVLGARLTTVPEGFVLHRSVERILEQRRDMTAGRLALDWGYAECLAYASLVDAGYPVRLSGQDSERGTFFHRHAVLHDQHTDKTHKPLQHISARQAPFRVFNSILSEEAVLGFEYGYSSSRPNALVIWEAQFGDFANGAQVVIDQFITSCEAKWQRYCGLVMLLPHGYDGQGPEHSSARLERYLQLCAEENIQVCIPSTPAQMFHLLRRQILRPYRKPLVIMSPKSLLRHKLSSSSLAEITGGGFQLVIDEVDPIDARSVERVLFCSGKVYYDLLETRRARRLQDIAIVRIEQLYPFPAEEVDAVLARYPGAGEVVWVQEEPRNQGAWVYLMARLHLFARLRETQQLRLVARPYCASPAVGYVSVHLQQQQAIVEEALRIPREDLLQQKTA